MFFYLSKILSFLFSPLHWIAILLLTALFYKRAAFRKKILFFITIITFVFGSNFIVDEIFRFYEPPKININDINITYDAVVVLGGGTTFDFENNLINFHESGDRFLIALQLYKQHKVKKLIISGGSGSMVQTEQVEADFIKNYFISIGVPEKDIIIDNTSRNTYENAVNTKKILTQHPEIKSLILITSAYHMPRAAACFKKAGILAFAFPVDFQHGKRLFYFDHIFIPDLKAFQLWETILHEWVGYLSYKIMGYL